MFGVKYSIRQRRINAPAVKRAIGTVLGEKALDADALNAQLQLARRLNIDEVRRLGDQNVSIVSEDGGELDLSLVDSRGKFDISAEEHELQIREEEVLRVFTWIHLLGYSLRFECNKKFLSCF
ncbi:unnamed protein product [Anisakis simplex]|uniref:ClpB_D2-small domain-containing protein n=1 Tax=Anisakis simplex TaxID=6269 RepID=A0A0M3JL64_ANISI|nr:unnamed protein product [Anisakis simplex]